MSARSASCSAGARRWASPSVWMFARSDEIGVRSSWLASAIRWRWAATERSSASRVALKLAASRPSSSRPATSRRRDRSKLPVSVSVLAVKRAIGASAVRATSAPSSAASTMPPTPIRARITSRWLSSRSTCVSGCATITAPTAPSWRGAPPMPTVSTRSCVPFTLLSLRLLPLPLAAIARSSAVSAISVGEAPCPLGTSIAPCADTNCT